MPSIYMKNEMTGDIKQIEEGFNWKVFLFGWIYLFYKQDIGSGFALMLIDVSVSVVANVSNSENSVLLLLIILIAHIVVANNWHKEYIKLLEKKDYVMIEKS